MSIMKLTHFDVPFEKAAEWGEAHPELMSKFFAKASKHGGKHHGALLGEGKFVGLDEWPSREAYETYRDEVSEAWGIFERDLGIDIRDEFWEFQGPHSSRTGSS